MYTANGVVVIALVLLGWDRIFGVQILWWACVPKSINTSMMEYLIRLKPWKQKCHTLKFAKKSREKVHEDELSTKAFRIWMGASGKLVKPLFQPPSNRQWPKNKKQENSSNKLNGAKVVRESDNWRRFRCFFPSPLCSPWYLFNMRLSLVFSSWPFVGRWWNNNNLGLTNFCVDFL